MKAQASWRVFRIHTNQAKAKPVNTTGTNEP
jgi:hypothetical protein